MSPPAPIAFNELTPLTGPATLRPCPETTISADGTSLSHVVRPLQALALSQRSSEPSLAFLQTVPKTDWWRTPQEARFSGPVLGKHVPAELASSSEGWTVGVELSGDWKIE